jgi:hypothetical protein
MLARQRRDSLGSLQRCLNIVVLNLSHDLITSSTANGLPHACSDLNCTMPSRRTTVIDPAGCW